MAKTAIEAAPRHRAGVSKARYEDAVERAKNAGKRLREATKSDEDVLVSVGAGIALAIAEEKTQLPTVAGLDPALVAGGLGYFFTRKSKAGMSKSVRQGSIALLTIGANRSYQRGSVKVAEAEDV